LVVRPRDWRFFSAARGRLSIPEFCGGREAENQPVFTQYHIIVMLQPRGTNPTAVEVYTVQALHIGQCPFVATSPDHGVVAAQRRMIDPDEAIARSPQQAGDIVERILPPAGDIKHYRTTRSASYLVTMSFLGKPGPP